MQISTVISLTMQTKFKLKSFDRWSVQLYILDIQSIVFFFFGDKLILNKMSFHEKNLE